MIKSINRATLRKYPHYTSIDNLKLWNFDMISQTGDKSYLVKKRAGKKTREYPIQLPKIVDERLTEVYQNIADEYLNAIGEFDDRKVQMEIEREILQLRTEYMTIRNCVFSLKLKYDPEIAYVLEEFGYSIDENQEMEPQFERIMHQASNLITQYSIEEKNLEFEKEKLSNTNGEKKSSIYDSLIILGKFQGYRLDPKKITVSEYLGIRKSLADANKNKRHNKQ